MKAYRHPVIAKQDIGTVIKLLRSGKPLSGFTGTPGGHLGGEHVRRLEDAFCEYFNVKYAVAMNSATACLHSAMYACGIKMGDEVITTPFSFSSSASCILMANAVPVFADIEERMFCLWWKSIEKVITPRTKAILPVHLCGHPADMDSIMALAKKYKLRVIEDAAQAIGAKFQEDYVGTIGDCGIFSFNQSKQISTGEGGMLITNDGTIADITREVRNHGEVAVGGRLGWNYRMTEIEAILALAQFKKLDKMREHREELATLFSFQLDNIDGITPPFTRSDCQHAWYTFAMRYDKSQIPIHRDEFQKRMLDYGVYFGAGYVKPLYLLPIYQTKNHDVYRYFGQEVDYSEGLCPVAEDLWRNTIMVIDWLRFPMTEEDVYEAVAVIRKVLEDIM